MNFELNEKNIIKILKDELFAHSDQSVREPASALLLEAQRKPGFCALLNGLIHSQVDDNMKRTSVIQYKLCVEKYWNNKDGYAISDKEKQEIRQSIFYLIPEPKISKFVDTIFVHITKVEFPEVWPKIFEMLLDQLNKLPHKRIRVLQVLYSCLKVIITEPDKLSHEDPKFITAREKRKNFGIISPLVFGTIAPIWIEANNKMLQSLSDLCQGKISPKDIPDILGEECSFCLKIIQLIISRYLPIFSSQNETDVIKLFEQIMFYLKCCVECQRAIEHMNLSIQSHLQRCILSLLELVTHTQLNFPLTVVPILLPFLEFFYNQFQMQYGIMTQFWEKYLIELFNFFANVLSSREYNESPEELKSFRRDPEYREQIIDEKVIHGQSIVIKFFSLDVLMTMIRILISRYLRLTPELLSLWKDYPEDFIEEEISDAYQYKITPCAEYFFYRILRFRSTDISNPLKTLLINTIDQCTKVNAQHTDFFESVLLKESCYYALGLANESLNNLIDIKEIIEKYLKPELVNTHQYSKILIRRVAYILETWAPETECCRRDTYNIVMHCLSDEDLVVRVYAAVALRNIIEEFDFDSGKYLDFIRPSLRSIIRLVNDMTGSTTTCHILNLISVIATELGENVRPYMDEIVSCISALWENSQEKKMVRASIIKILSTMVEVLAGGAAELEKHLIPVLLFSITSHEESIYILDEALLLWSKMIEQSGYLSPNHKNIFPYVVKLAETNRDDHNTLRKIVHLIECYLLIGKEPFVKQYINQVIPPLYIAMVHLKRASHICETIEVLDTFIQMYSVDAPRVLHSCIQLTWKIIITKEKKNLFDIGFTQGLLLFCRILLENRDYFFQFFQDITLKKDKLPKLTKFIELVVAHVNEDTMKFLDDYNLAVISLSTLLPTTDTTILQYLPRIVEFCVNTFKSLKEKSNHARKYQRKSTMIRNSPCYRAKRILESKDKALLNKNCLKFMIERLREAQQINGPTLDQIVSKFVKKETLEFLQNPPEN